MHLAAHVALILTIIGGIETGSSHSINTINTGITLRHVGVILFLVVFVLIVLVTAFLWANKRRILMHRRTVSTCPSLKKVISFCLDSFLLQSPRRYRSWLSGWFTPSAPRMPQQEFLVSRPETLASHLSTASQVALWSIS